MAFTMDCDLGVDIEAVRPMPDIEDIARRFFCAEETADLMALSTAQRDQGFFLCWTRKEAYIKATGEGLSAPLDAFQVTLRPGEAARMIHLERDPIAAQAWTLHDLMPGSRYAAALAYRIHPALWKHLNLLTQNNCWSLRDFVILYPFPSALPIKRL
jgi:4'-phosphopantetheinyl transferase